MGAISPKRAQSGFHERLLNVTFGARNFLPVVCSSQICFVFVYFFAGPYGFDRDYSLEAGLPVV